MPSYVINGGIVLKGDLHIQGSKNAVLPLMAAALVNKGITVLHNCPDISDVTYMIAILEYTGCIITRNGHTVIIDATDVTGKTVPDDMVKHVRASVLIMGAMLARSGYVLMDYPGGCMIGARPVDYHLDAFMQLGVQVFEKEDKLECCCSNMKGTTIRLPFPSVGATENALIAAMGASGKTVILNAAREPEIDELCNFLSCMGVRVGGCGTSMITIEGRGLYHDVEYTVSSDRIVAGTYACAAIATGGEVYCRLNDCNGLTSIGNMFDRLGCNIVTGNDYVFIKAKERLDAIPYIVTEPYPGFPTDMQSQFMSVLAKANGRSVIEETIFEDRFQTVDELNEMGADISIKGNKAYINGVSRLHGARVESKELRGGAALIIAALSAEGQSIVHDVGYISRGYEDIAGSIVQLGGKMWCEKI